MPDCPDDISRSSQSRSGTGLPVFSLNNDCPYCLARAPGLCAHFPMIMDITNDTAIDGGGPVCLSARRRATSAGDYIWDLTESTGYDPVEEDDLDGTAESPLDRFALELARAEARELFGFLRIATFRADPLHVYIAYPTGSNSLAGPAPENIDMPDEGLFPPNRAVVLVPTNPNLPSVMLRPTKALSYDDDAFEAWSVTVTTVAGPLDMSLKSASEAASTAKALINGVR